MITYSKKELLRLTELGEKQNYDKKTWLHLRDIIMRQDFVIENLNYLDKTIPYLAKYGFYICDLKEFRNFIDEHYKLQPSIEMRDNYVTLMKILPVIFDDFFKYFKQVENNNFGTLNENMAGIVIFGGLTAVKPEVHYFSTPQEWRYWLEFIIRFVPLTIENYYSKRIFGNI